MPLPVVPTYLPNLRVRVVHNNSSSVSAALANPSLTLVVSKATAPESGAIVKVFNEIELIIERGAVLRRVLIWKVPEFVAIIEPAAVTEFGVAGGLALIKVTGDVVAIIENRLNARAMARVNTDVVAIIERSKRIRSPLTSLLRHAIFPSGHQHLGPYEDT